MFHELLVQGKPLKEVVKAAARQANVGDLDKLSSTGAGFDDIRVVHGCAFWLR